MQKLKEDDKYIYIQPTKKVDEMILKNAGGEYTGNGVYRLSKSNRYAGMFGGK